MKLFVAIQEYGAMIGIYPPKTDKTSIINGRNIAVFLMLASFSLSSTAYIVLDVDTFSEYTVSFFWWITVSLTCFGFVVNVLKTRKLFEVVWKTESMVEIRKFTIFTKEHLTSEKKDDSMKKKFEQRLAIPYRNIFAKKQKRKQRNGQESRIH